MPRCWNRERGGSRGQQTRRWEEKMDERPYVYAVGGKRENEGRRREGGREGGYGRGGGSQEGCGGGRPE